jgi:hypothetical protein
MAQIDNTVLTDTFSKFVADHNAVKNRLGLGVNNGETTSLGTLALFNRTLNTSVTIDANTGAIGADTVVPLGVTLTVDGTLVIL